MSTTGLEVFDQTLQKTNIWLKDIMGQVGPDRQRAYHALRAVLHTLRDRLTVEEAAHLSAQLPLLIRGIYFEGWHPAHKPTKERARNEFLEQVEARLQGIEPINPETATRSPRGARAACRSGGSGARQTHAAQARSRSLAVRASALVSARPAQGNQLRGDLIVRRSA
jgi:uncharacterized protein (DUF2267 family)